MAQLIVRNLDDALVRALRVRAAMHGRSAEAEHREILREALCAPATPRPTLKQLLAAMPDVGDDGDFVRARDLARPVDLETAG